MRKSQRHILCIPSWPNQLENTLESFTYLFSRKIKRGTKRRNQNSTRGANYYSPYQLRNVLLDFHSRNSLGRNERMFDALVLQS